MKTAGEFYSELVSISQTELNIEIEHKKSMIALESYIKLAIIDFQMWEDYLGDNDIPEVMRITYELRYEKWLKNKK